MAADTSDSVGVFEVTTTEANVVVVGVPPVEENLSLT